MLQLHDLGVWVNRTSLKFTLQERDLLFKLRDLELGRVHFFLQFGRRSVKVKPRILELRRAQWPGLTVS